MSKVPSVQEFKLSVNRDPASSQISVEDLTAGGKPKTLSEQFELPVFLAVDHHPDTHAELVVRPAAPVEPFDPEVTRDGNVLAVETRMTDASFSTRDDTRYVVRLTNRSRYYVAEDIHVAAELAERARDVCVLPDGNLTLSLSPHQQHIRCISPGQSEEVSFVAISRGPPPGLYPVRITLRYRLLYWDGRIARAVSEQVLPVDTPYSAVPVSRQPPSERSHAMPESPNPSNYFPPVRPPQHHHRPLEPIEIDIPLHHHHHGHLTISYRLLKHSYPDPAQAPGCYGKNPETKEIESRFSTQDTAALEVKLHNQSQYELKHVRLSQVRIIPFVEGDRPEPVQEQKLPDGNLLFEVVPNEVYYGRINPGEKEIKYLTLITRGVAPGRYSVHMDAQYDIEQCKVPVNLFVAVRPD